jgi:6-phosphogluconate dehydrogenase
MSQLQFGLIGLGRMGGGLATHALKQGMKVVGYDLNPPDKKLTDAGMIAINDYKGFAEHLESPRIIFVYIPSGHAIDVVMDGLLKVLKKGDIVVDGGNSYWGDSIRRHKKYLELGINFIDIGTSGGISGAEFGACFMLGGDKEVVAHVEPILKKLSVPNGYVHAGPAGAGHFVKLVHNGINYGMAEAIGEGVALLESCPLKIDIAKTLDVYSHGSVIRSWFMDLMRDSYKENKGLSKIDSYVDDTGEVNWLVDDAMHMEVAVPVISAAVMQCINSRDNKKNWARAVSLLRHTYGGHAFGHSKVSQDERYRGREGGYYYNGVDPNTIVQSKED